MSLATRPGRGIVKRIVVRGILTLDTPTLLGNGDADGPTDLSLLRDSISDRALLTGASLAGALRQHLHARLHGYSNRESENDGNDLVAQLFGTRRGGDDDEDTQSCVIVSDALSRPAPLVELRDGVSIDGRTGTALDGAKYDLELLAAGTTFPLLFELLVPSAGEQEDALRLALALALEGLERTAVSGSQGGGEPASSSIALGGGKSRGLGRCHVDGWDVRVFDLIDPRQRLAWLFFDRGEDVGAPTVSPSKDGDEGRSIIATLCGDWAMIPDLRHDLSLRVRLSLDGPLLIRSGQDEQGLAPDVVHLRSRRPGVATPLPVVSGSTLAGVLRHRAVRIVAAVGRAPNLVDSLFGYVTEGSGAADDTALASRLRVNESVVEGNPIDMVQQRISIDRFTGGAYPGALFTEGILAGGATGYVDLDLFVQQPSNDDIGLLLLLLKDLWTGDLPIGGGSAIGRGRLRGHEAWITLREPHRPPDQAVRTWHIAQQESGLAVDGLAALESFVRALVEGAKRDKELMQ